MTVGWNLAGNIKGPQGSQGSQGSQGGLVGVPLVSLDGAAGSTTALTPGAFHAIAASHNATYSLPASASTHQPIWVFAQTGSSTITAIVTTGSDSFGPLQNPYVGGGVPDGQYRLPSGQAVMFTTNGAGNWTIGDDQNPGPQGSQGTQGSQGLRGFQGFQGGTGSQGFQGATGAQGPAGLVGTIGGANLLVNSELLLNGLGTTDGWTGNNAGNTSYVETGTAYVSGNSAMFATGSGYQFNIQYLTFKANQTYTVSYYIKADSGFSSQNGAGIVCDESFSAASGTTHYLEITPPTVWTRRSFTFTVGTSDSSGAHVLVTNTYGGTSSGGAVRISNVQVELSSVASAYAPSGDDALPKTGGALTGPLTIGPQGTGGAGIVLNAQGRMVAGASGTTDGGLYVNAAQTLFLGDNGGGGIGLYNSGWNLVQYAKLTYMGTRASLGNGLSVGANSSQGDMVVYADTFDGTLINTNNWVVTQSTAGNVSQSNGISVTGNSAWTTNGIASVNGYRRSSTLTMVVDVLAGTSGCMVGFTSSNASLTYANMPHAVYFQYNTIIIYEDNNAWSTSYPVASGVTYRVRIEVALTGATYWISADGGDTWTKLWDSTNGAVTDSPLYPQVVTYSGVVTIDNLVVSNGEDYFAHSQFFDRHVNVGGRVQAGALAVGANSSQGDMVVFTDTFDGTIINATNWKTTQSTVGNVVQNGNITFSGGNSTWTSNGLTAVNAYRRNSTLTLVADLSTPSPSNVMFGFSSSPSSLNYTNMPHAIDFNGTSITIYENGTNVVTPAYTTTIGYVYRVRIEATGSGASYWISADNAETWILLYDGTGNGVTTSPLYPQINMFGPGSAVLDNLVVSNGDDYLVRSQFFDRNVTIGRNLNIVQTIDHGTRLGATEWLYNGGAGVRFGFGVNNSEKQSFVSNGSIWSWNKGGDLQPSGTNRVMTLDTSGNMALLGTASAATPTVATHLTTKAYVDNSTPDIGYTPISGAYTMPSNVLSVGAGAPPTGQASFYPLDVGSGGWTPQSIVCYLTTLQVAGTATLVKMALYADRGDGGGPLLTPSGLLFQSTVNALAAGGAVGARSATYTTPLTQGRYWTCLLYYQGTTAPTTAPQFNCSTNATSLWSPSGSPTAVIRALVVTGLTDLPTASQTVGGTGGSTAPIVVMRRA